MDERVKAIADKAQNEFGLERYRLERYTFHENRKSPGFILNMEWFPIDFDGPVEEDMNPDGTASIDYDIQSERFTSAIFTMGRSYSTAHPFKVKTIEEAAAWLEKITNLAYKQDFFAEQASENGFRFIARKDNVRLSPNLQLNVEFDDDGRLLLFSTYGEAPNWGLIEKQEFNLTLEEIEPIVKKHLTLVKFPSESEERFVHVYAIDEVYVTADGKRTIPFLLDDLTTVEMDHLMEWDEPLEGKIERQSFNVTKEVSADEAFNSHTVEDIVLTDEMIDACVKLVHGALRMEYPADSGKWTLRELRPTQTHIEAFCYADNPDNFIFRPKMVLIIDKDAATVINLIDNKGMFDIFNSFTPAPEPKVDHETAFEKMVPYITLDPVYVYDKELKKYVLCGLIDSDLAVDAVTGEIIALQDL
ncbi:hypothetical protein [Sporosarcina highlanderae]|uniref:PepSY domain-containing protein n=1 Tax=Sporosarcina highlanderae TaxID=3035916 RepID=A0ABT8JP66_9BACL|nr:hypothetical protein [Sporosarcina highlanderae]MDN4606598.1 hypothetical protein [Sporosarcina highlanderae]